MVTQPKSSTSTTRKVGRALVRLFEYDFFPNVNPYVYWLKQPVGWFVIALFSSILVGAFLSPVGWSLAAGILAILCIGLGFPWVAVRAAKCQLRPLENEIREWDDSNIVFEVQNRLPISLLGLMVEGYLTVPTDLQPSQNRPDIGLSIVPPLSIASFRLPIRPLYRGVYPIRTPQLACSFPFGIWTARRRIDQVHPVTVQPLLIGLSATLELAGRKIADSGTGNRISSNGEFLGVRTFRRGDPLKSIHWVQSARIDALVVCERGGPQQNDLVIRLDTSACLGSSERRRDNLAWRVRIAASMIDLCAARHIPFQLSIDDIPFPMPIGSSALRMALNRLALIPLDSSIDINQNLTANSQQCGLFITADHEDFSRLDAQNVRIALRKPSVSFRSQQDFVSQIIDLSDDIKLQIDIFLNEANLERIVA